MLRGSRIIITGRRIAAAAGCCELLKLRRIRLKPFIVVPEGEKLTGAPRRRNKNQAVTALAFWVAALSEEISSMSPTFVPVR